MLSVEQLLEKELQKINPDTDRKINIGNFFITENEPLYEHISQKISSDKDADKSFLSLRKFYSYFTKTFKKPIKIEYDNSPNDAPITKQLVHNLYKEHRENKDYDERYHQYARYAKKQREVESSYEKDYNSYINYSTQKPRNTKEKEQKSQQSPILSKTFFSKKRPYLLPEIESHTYISGATGCGKSETIKLLIHHYLTKSTESSIILFDPHGDLSEELVRFKENIESDKLVYIHPKLDRNLVPKFNPFALPDIKDKKILAEIIEETSARFVEIMSEVFESYELTSAMKTVLKNCFMVLCHMPNTSFMDIIHMMDKNTGKKYLDYANKNITNPITLLFLNTKLYDDANMTPTREAIKNRFFSLLQYDIFNNMTTGEETFHLEELMNQKKFIIFNFAGVSELPRNIFGKLLISQIRVIGEKRELIKKSKRTPCHVFIDECQLFITASLKDGFQQLRKFKIHLTLVQQNIGDEMSLKLKKSVMTNANLKIVGHNEAGDLKAMSDNINVAIKELQNLQKGQFYIKLGSEMAVRVQMHSHLVETKNSMTENEYQKLAEKQKQQYYTEIKQPDTKEILKIIQEQKQDQQMRKNNKNSDIGIWEKDDNLKPAFGNKKSETKIKSDIETDAEAKTIEKI